MKRFLLALILLASPALAQNVTNHAVPIGRGPGVSGFAAAGPCAAAQALVWVSSVVDPTCTSIIIGTAQPLSSVNDTNVTVTLGGTPTTALLQSVSMTLGWTGTLAANRLNSNVVQSVVNDTNVTGSIASQVLTLGWTGILGTGRLGTGIANSSTFLRGDGTWSVPNRLLLTSPTTFFASPAGGGNCLAVGTPCTLAVLANLLTTGYDLGGQTITIQLANGTYTTGFGLNGIIEGQSTQTITSTNPNTACPVQILGNTSSPSSVVVQGGAGMAFWALNGACFNISGVSVSSAGNDAIQAYGGGNISINGPIAATATSGCILAARLGGRVTVLSPASVSIGGASSAYACFINNGILVHQGISVTLTANVTFSVAIFNGQLAGSSRSNGTSFIAGAFTISGPAYTITGNAVMNNGACGSLPGTAGTTGTGGQCF